MRKRFRAGLALTLLFSPLALRAQTDSAAAPQPPTVTPVAEPADPAPAAGSSSSSGESTGGGKNAAAASMPKTVTNGGVADSNRRRRVSEIRSAEDRREIRRGVREIEGGLREERRGVLLVDEGEKLGGARGAALTAEGRALERGGDYRIVRGERTFVRGADGLRGGAAAGGRTYGYQGGGGGVSRSSTRTAPSSSQFSSFQRSSGSAGRERRHEN